MLNPKSVFSSVGRNVFILSACQALGSSGLPLVILAGSIVGADLAPASTWATLPMALAVVGSAFFTIPAALLMKRIGRKRSFIMAAGVSYYVILSIFPILLGLIAIFGFFLPSLNLQDELIQFIGRNLPGAADILEQNIASIVRIRGILGILSVVVLFWSGSTMFSAISLAINHACDIRRYRRFFIRKASELAMALSTGILFLLSLGASVIASILRGVSDLPAAILIIVDIGSRLVAFLLILVVFLLLYKLIPCTRTYWRYVWPGALLAAVLFEIARTVFVFYLDNFANYQLIYGSIASVIVLLVWIYYSAFIMILGAEFTFQYGQMHHTVTTESDTQP
ncbi:MAG: YihY/virulence factor BrkB family protein [Dehalococcoidales bacterium]|nr:YihY/virulence factor BrkB family protein [Dehalococcoidales bacterium]